MADITNQAKLTYSNNRSALSNIATGTFVAPYTITKAAVNNDYVSNDDVTYIVTINNTSPSALTNITVVDNLGAYTYGALTLYPLTFVGPVLYYINGTPQANITPTQTTPILELTVPTVPSNGSVTLVYEVEVNQFAPLDVDESITNAVTIPELDGISATATIFTEAIPQLAITKSISPNPIIDNQPVTYTFIINNYGNTASSDVVLTDLFDPVLTDIVVTNDGTVLVEGDDYTYAAGLLTILSGVLTVPAATFTQDANGVVTATPGSTTVVVTGIV
jgi:uncharacterized repeat protein (TIGR01451 family)